MTVPSEVSQVTYVGNGVTTEFAVGFRYLANSELVVTLQLDGEEAATTLTEGIQYTLPEDPSETGTVTFEDPPPDDSTVTITRDVDFTQLTSFRTQGSFSPKVHEDAFDESVFRDQELARRISLLEGGTLTGPVVAGDGLSFSGTQLNVGAGDGLMVDGDDISIDFGLAADIVNVAKSAASAGVVEKPARIDHKHNVSTAAAVQISAAGASSEGVAATLARSDHTHDIAAGGVVTSLFPDNSGTEGELLEVARADHTHTVACGLPVEITDTDNAEGDGESFARNNHQHAHGERGGGALHAPVTRSANGFKSSGDKRKSNLEYTSTQGVIQEADTTESSPLSTSLTTTTSSIALLCAINLLQAAADTALCVVAEVLVCASEIGGDGGKASWGRVITAGRVLGGTLTEVTTSALWTHRNTPAETAGWEITPAAGDIALNAPIVLVYAQSHETANIAWTYKVRILTAPTQ